MRYEDESMLEKSIRWIGKFLLNIVVFGLLVVVVTQFIIINSDFEQSLIARFPQVKKILELNQEQQFTQQAKMVFAPQQEYIVFIMQGSNKSWKVQLVVNGQVVGNFAQGKVKAEIKEGDQIAINAVGYKKGLWLRVAELSIPLQTFKQGEQFWIKNEYKNLGIVKLKGKF
ncbi:MAG: hypothetical protein ACQERJ_06260 [Bacillota bacterium]